MALARPLLWVPRSICFTPAAVPAVPRLHQLRDWTLKQNVKLLSPWSPGGHGIRRTGLNRFRHLQFFAIHSDQSRSGENLNGDEAVDQSAAADKKPKPAQRRRRRRKTSKDTNISAVVSAASNKEGALADGPGSSGGSPTQSSGNHVSSEEENVQALDAKSGDEDLVVRDAASETGEVSSKPSEVESKAPSDPSRKKRRSRSRKKGTSKDLQAGEAADKLLSESEIESELSLAAVVKVERKGGESKLTTPDTLATRENAIDLTLASDATSEKSDPVLESSALHTNLDSWVAEKSSPVGGDLDGQKKKKKSKSNGTEQKGNGNQGDGAGDSAAISSTLVNERGGVTLDHASTAHQSTNDQASLKPRRRRGRRKKSVAGDNDGVTAVELKSDNGGLRPGVDVRESFYKVGSDAAGANQNRAGTEVLEGSDAKHLGGGDGQWMNNSLADSQGNRNDWSAGDDGEDLAHGAKDDTEDLGTLQLEADLRPPGVSNLQKKSNGSVNGATAVAHDVNEVGELWESEEEIRRESSRNAADFRLRDEGGALDSVPVEGLKPARRNRRRRRSKKRGPESAQEDPISEQAEFSAKDPLSSVIWCNVKMKVQASLEQNEVLFVAGANPEFGRWDLSMALELTESEDEGYLETSVKIPRGTMLEYKYFLEIRDGDSIVMDRLFGPEIQYLLPWKDGEDANFEQIRDVWVPDVPKNLPLLSWGDRWWEEMDSAGREEDEFRDSTKEDMIEEDFQDVSTGEFAGLDEVEPLVAGESRKAGTDSEDWWLKRKTRRKVFPREEPWLMESMILEQRKLSLRKRTEDPRAETELLGGRAAVASDEEQKEPAVQVEILINSPQCTMQRVAILEDKKLVELLVEPVTARVQVGNIYLGVVKQLLPGMNGVFVDIGSFQLSLLDITRNQYPYTFPSIAPANRELGDTQPWHLFDDEEEDSDWDGADLEDEELDDEDDDDEEEDENEDGEDDEGEILEVENESFNGEGGRAAEEGGSGNKTSLASVSGQEHFVEIGANTAARTVNFGRKLRKWRKLSEGMQIIVQVKKEALGKKGPRLTAFPSLAGRFWVLIPGSKAVGVSRRITGPERKRLRKLAKELQPENFSLTVRTEAVGLDREDLEKDLARLMETWKEVLECASAAAVAGDHGMDGSVPVLLHRAMGQTLTLVRDFFTDRVQKMVIDSPQCYQEVTSYLQEVAPQLSDRVELYTDQAPIFDAFHIEPEIEKFSNKRVSLPNGGYLVIEETEALVSVDVNGGSGVLSQDVFQEEANLAVNLAAATQLARELRLRDIGGIIVVDFIDMEDQKSQDLVVEEMRKATARDRSSMSFSEISEFGLMQITRRRVRPSVTVMTTDSCSHCGGVGRVEAHEATLSKVERALLRLLAKRPAQADPLEDSKWPQINLRVDAAMGEYLKGRKRKRLTQLSAALKVWLHLKVALELSAGHFQLLEQQQRPPNDKRVNGSGPTKSNQQNSTNPGLFGKKGVLPAKRRRNFFNHASNR